MAVNDKETEEAVRLWIKDCLQNENISQHQVSMLSISKKEQGGYLGDILFVEASGMDEKNVRKKLDFVVKISKKNEILRNSFPVRESFRREIFLYNDVFPVFNKFLSEKEAKFKLNFVPKCYKTIFKEGTEAIILENLKIKGLQLHSKTKPLDLTHIKLVLLHMAELHAVSFAFRDQVVHEFEDLVRHFNSMLSITVEEESMQTLFRNEMFSAIEFLREIKENDLAEQLKEKIGNDPGVFLKRVYDETVEQSVILHGDTWINNYMFRYEDNNPTIPAAVAFLDWQLSSLHSPVLDVSQFLYAVGSKEALVTEFKQLMEFYHHNLSSSLRELGSDPEKIFPFSSLTEHWKKYSVASLIFVVGFLKTIVSEGDKMARTEDITSGFGDVFSNVRITNLEVYQSRLVAIVQNFCSS